MSTSEPIFAVYKMKVRNAVRDSNGVAQVTTNLERNVIVPDTNLQLLFADDVLLWPIGIVFPTNERSRWGQKKTQWADHIHVLCDLARFYYPLELLDDQWTNPHYNTSCFSKRTRDKAKVTYSLCELSYHSCSWSCSRIGDGHASIRIRGIRVRACQSALY